MKELVTRSGGAGRTSYVVHLGKDERALLVRLCEELREVVTGPADPASVQRLFPVVHPDEPGMEAEYQRLMRDELIASRLGAIEVVVEVLGGGGRRLTLDEAQLHALVQSVNGVRLVLGTVLEVSDDDEDRPELVGQPEYELYAYLSWLLDSAVRAMS